MSTNTQENGFEKHIVDHLVNTNGYVLRTSKDYDTINCVDSELLFQFLKTTQPKAVQNTISSPLLSDNDITGAANILLNITYGANQILMVEFTEILDYIEEKISVGTEVMWGHGLDEKLEDDEISITIIAKSFTFHH